MSTILSFEKKKLNANLLWDGLQIRLVVIEMEIFITASDFAW